MKKIKITVCIDTPNKYLKSIMHLINIALQLLRLVEKTSRKINCDIRMQVKD